MKIYTRKGDDGSTGLFGGGRVSKAAPRVEAYGLVDELSAVLGWARVALPPPEVDEGLASVQETCFRIGAWLASAPGADPRVTDVSAGDVRDLEERIDRLEAELPALSSFVLPGGSEAGARLHVARTVARRVERHVTALAAKEALAPALVPWLNRLSDWLFVAARFANQRAGRAEEVWRPRASREPEEGSPGGFVSSGR